MIAVVLIAIIGADGVAAKQSDFAGRSSTSRVKIHSFEAKYMFGDSKYHYFKDYLRITFDIKKRRDVDTFAGILLRIESSDQQYKVIMLEWNEQSEFISVLLLDGDRIDSYKIPDFVWPADSLPTHTSLTLDFRDNFAILEIGGMSARIKNLDLSIDKGYRFSLLPALSNRLARNSSAILEVSNLEVDVSEMPAKSKAWWWVTAIIVIDLAIYFVMLHRRRRKRRKSSYTPLHSDDADGVVKQVSDTFTLEQLPKISAIHLFGGFYVYDANGNDITKQFSPMLKELLCLIVVHSTEGGISADQLKDTLWFDKETKNARNNRSVYFGKLRTILSKMGSYTLSNETGYWKLSTADDIFIDYFEYKKIEAEKSTEDSHIEKLLTIVQHGNLMPNTSYEWFDPFKANVADFVIEQLCGYSRSLNIDATPDLAIAIADVISQFDKLNEHALYLKCKAYNSSGRHSLAKNTYDLFAQKYREIYDTNLSYGFADLLNRKPDETDI